MQVSSSCRRTGLGQHLVFCIGLFLFGFPCSFSPCLLAASMHTNSSHWLARGFDAQSCKYSCRSIFTFMFKHILLNCTLVNSTWHQSDGCSHCRFDECGNTALQIRFQIRRFCRLFRYPRSSPLSLLSPRFLVA